MDGLSTDFKFLEKIQKDCLDYEQNESNDNGSCRIHSNHGAFKNAAESANWNIKKTLHGSRQILHHTPLKGDDHETVTSSDVYPHKFRARRYIL